MGVVPPNFYKLPMPLFLIFIPVNSFILNNVKSCNSIFDCKTSIFLINLNLFHYSVLSSEVIISNQRSLCLFLTDGRTSAPGSFLFSLRHNDDLAPFKASLKNENDVRAIKRNSDAGPTFGRGIDLRIYDNAGSNTLCFSRFGYSYQAPPGYTHGETITGTLLAGSYNFSPSEIEVLYLN